MRLTRVNIERYRSIKEPLALVPDEHVSVILGANDHGKTNLLAAIQHLNPDQSFTKDDLNWDSEDRESHPLVEFELELSEQERDELSRLDTAERLRSAAEHARGEAQEQIRELRRALEEDRQASEVDASEETEQAADTAPGAGETSDPNSDEATDAAEPESEQEARSEEAGQNEATVLIENAELSSRLAYARLLEAEELKGRESVEGVVERLADEAAVAVEAANEVLSESDEQVSSAEAELERVKGAEPEDAGKVQRAERDLEKAQENAAAAREKAEAQGSEAQELRASAGALGRVNEGDDVAKAADVGPVKSLPASNIPERIRLSRKGLGGRLEPAKDGAVDVSAVQNLLDRRLPRVELIEPVEKIRDTVSRNQITEDNFVFMRGIFAYGGIKQGEWDQIFIQDDQTRMRLEEASRELNETLGASWSQGSNLEFSLRHDSKSSRIDLLIRDPAVQRTFTRPSRRSSGFTHFFALKTILHALQRESPASSYIWLFDEPGLHLHPDGQRDLIQVMETLAQRNQVVYTTHSIFLVNKNYPTRHRLVVKEKKGTRLDGKPFIGRWQAALEALGLSLSGSLLFASHVLLVEGDSDAIFINALLRKLIAMGRIDIDLNSLAVIGTGDPGNTEVLIRLLSETGIGEATPKVAVLVDGDSGGEKRLKGVAKILKDRKIPGEKLAPKDTTTEDHLPAATSLYVRALASYLAPMLDLDSETCRSKVQSSFDAQFPKVKDAITGLANWTRGDVKDLFGMENKPSPVGVARSYADLLEEIPAEELKARGLERALKLGEWIQVTLGVPGQRLEQEEIIDAEL